MSAAKYVELKELFLYGGDFGIEFLIILKLPLVSFAGDEYGLFHINRRTGNVTVKGVLDREYYPQFTLQIEAYEAENVNSYARININIKLTDENDNKPKFEHDHYNFELTEDELSPQRIVSKDKIKAYDEDFEVTRPDIFFYRNFFLLEALNSFMRLSKYLEFQLQWTNFYLDYSRSRTNASEPLYGHSRQFSFLYLELSLCQYFSLQFFIVHVPFLLMML